MNQSQVQDGSGDRRFLCAMRVKNEAHHLPEVLSRALRLCGGALVFDDHSTDGTPDVCRAFGHRVIVLHSRFEGLDEARDKNELLRWVIALGPEWVLWIDGDEVLEQTGPEKLRAAVDAATDVAGYSLRIAYLWNDAEHVRVDGVFGRFARPSFFRLKGQPVAQLSFRSTSAGGNFHCGNVPQGLVGTMPTLDVRLKHYGYMSSEQRKAKYDWYNAVDPNNDIEDNYRHIIEVPGARHAPGPTKIVPWTE